ncbi:MAG: hypothetical protein HQL30_02085 [Candidatus Omnitrophica bacterium]|nr:hypothetical protein [Candidatus Omnitrophota bacterium]
MPIAAIVILAVLFLFELAVAFTVGRLRRDFQWLITPRDERPVLDPEGLKKFLEHGYDPELGWIRKPNTSHPEKGKHGSTSYHMDDRGARRHPGLGSLPLKIACFGDSFTFCRQTNDDETWPWFLASFSGAGVVNFGVGNYGLDQAYIRMERELGRIDPEIVIMGVVPSTIVRILCVWKHYNEFGNTFGFKPRFDLRDGLLVRIDNIIDDASKLGRYEEFLDGIRSNDFFYRTKFRDEMLRFPYLYSVLRKPGRNIPIITALLMSKLYRAFGVTNSRIDEYPMMKIMEINRDLRVRLFGERYSRGIFSALVSKFSRTAEEKGIQPVFLFMPQKDDVLFIRERGNYYEKVIGDISNKVLTVDMTEILLGRGDLDELYSDDNVYGGHYSKLGNELVARTVLNALREKGYLSMAAEGEKMTPQSGKHEK